jgi:26S proteasome regulatory subunit N6
VYPPPRRLLLPPPLPPPLPQARTAKAVRTVLDLVGRAAPVALDLQLSLCAEVIDWCNAEKRTFLRQRVQSRLASLLFLQGRYQEAVVLVNR